MLGSNLGQKVNPEFVKNQYQVFLKNDGKVVTPTAVPIIRKTKEQRREEARKKGYYVMADDKEFENSIMEVITSKVQPAICKQKARKLKWKKDASKKSKKTKKKPKAETPRKPQEEKNPIATILNKPAEAHRQPSAVDLKTGKERSPEKKKTEKTDKSADKTDKSVEKTDKSVEKSHDESEAPAKKISATKAPEKAPPSELVSCRSDMSTYRQPSDSKSLLRNKKDDVFDKINEDDDITKVLLNDMDAVDKSGMGVADKQLVKAARHVLKVAHKEKTFEKTLSKSETELLVKFFSGKLAYDAKVLKVLDTALDKVVEALKKREAKLDDETRQFINQREKLKAAMFEEIIKSPQYIPRSWTQQYSAWHDQAMKETAGINWFRIAMRYPRQKCFEDGPEDQFGNFSRQRRHWIVGCIIGPRDSKTFEETAREKTCQGFYMDPTIMQRAKDLQAKSSSDLVSASTRTEPLHSPASSDPKKATM